MRFTGPEKPWTLIAVTVEVAFAPIGMMREVGVIVMMKLPVLCASVIPNNRLPFTVMMPREAVISIKRAFSER